MGYKNMVNTEVVEMFRDTLSDFLASPTKQIANQRVDELVKPLKFYVKKIESYKAELTRQQHRTNISNLMSSTAYKKEHPILYKNNIAEAKDILSTSYSLIYNLRQSITKEKILYHTLILNSNGSPIQVVEYDMNTLFKDTFTKIEWEGEKYNIALRIVESQENFKDLLDENTKANVSSLWTETDRALYEKFLNIRASKGWSPQVINNGHIFELADRYAMERRHIKNMNRIYNWIYTEEEMADILWDSRDQVPGYKRGDTLNIQNKGMRATIFSIDQATEQLNTAIQILESFKNVGLQEFKDALKEQYTSYEKIADTALKQAEIDMVDKAREAIQNLFNNMKI